MRRLGMLVVLAAVAAAPAACSDEGTVDPGVSTLGTLIVTTSTTGEDIHLADYTISVNGGPAASIGATGERTITGLPAGDHQVELGGVPWNCAVAGENPRKIAVAGGATARADFDGSCVAASPLIDQVAFWSVKDGEAWIYIMNADGSGQARIVAGAEPAVSPDGTRILFARGGDVYVANANGSAVTSLTDHPASDIRPRWSPDGTRIAFASDRDAGQLEWDIFVMMADGSEAKNLTQNPAQDNGATWSPDGTRIAFTSNRTGDFDIFVMAADGSDPVNLTNDTERSDYAPAWSPDAGRIAFASNGAGSGEIFVMNPDGSDRVNLTNDPSFNTGPSWSRDGSRITFTSNRTGNGQVFLMNADGSAPTNLSNRADNHSAGFPQAWSRVATPAAPDGVDQP